MTTAAKTMKATGFVDERGELHLDEPLEMPPGRVSVLVEYDDTGDDRRIWSAQQAFDVYVQRVKDVDIVQEVLLVGEGIETTIYTIIDTPLMHSESRYPVYDAEAEISRATEKPMADFQIVNVQPPRKSSMDVRVNNLRSKSRASWKRSDDLSR